MLEGGGPFKARTLRGGLEGHLKGCLKGSFKGHIKGRFEGHNKGSAKCPSLNLG